MAIDERTQEWLDRPYEPEAGLSVPNDVRMAKSLEYSAHHLWRISQRLDTLIAETRNLLELVSAQNRPD